MHDYADAWPGEEADTLAVGDGGIGVRGPPDFADSSGYVSGRMDVEHGEVLPGVGCGCGLRSIEGVVDVFQCGGH